MLDLQNSLYKQGEKHLSAFGMMNCLKPLKNDGEHDWLYEVSSLSLQVICQDLDQAYRRFFGKQAKYPKFKSRKRSRPSYPLRSDGIYFLDERVAKIAKLGKVKYKTDFTLPYGRDAKFTNPRITYANGKWMLSFGMECENQVPQLKDESMGIDLGVKEQAVAAFGDEQLVFHNINKSKRVRELTCKLKHTQRSLARKYQASKKTNGKFVKSNNYVKEQGKLRRIYQRIANVRNNYIHQTTHQLVSMLPYRVVMEDLNVRGMMKNRHLARSIQEQNLCEFNRQMHYKCEWSGIEFVEADRFYPSSKTCSCCGEIKTDLKLKDRVYKCSNCGNEIDRDFNAALNLSRYVA